ncbi:MAG: glycoside hydrolase family 127 protein, partial [Planctomycetaceae bacterium]|nr:glycoside hydrolase family 127 protein [Planctomycetaceae bacterium]
DKQLTLLPATGDTHAGGYVTCFFPGMEGLTKLYIVTKNKKYLETAERMAGFYRLFDVPDTTHVHGMLCCHYAFLLLYQETGNKDYLDRVVERWETLTANGVVSAIGGTPEAARLQFGQDEGCALADWLRVNVKLFEITRNPRYLEAAERLIHNHYLMNEWSDGGFGHRTLLYDRAGTYGLGLHRLECVWCCNYHGTMGFDYFKKSLAFLEPDGLHLQFAVDFEASLIDHGRKVDLRSQVRYNSPSTKAKDTVELPKGIVLSQELEFRGGNVKNGMLSVRIPDWADSVTLRTADGNTIETGKTGKYVKTQENISFEQPVIVDYHGGVFVENRMGKRINPQADEKGRFGPLVFRYGPKVLVAEGIQNIPMIKIPSDGGRFPELDPTKLTFDCSVPVKINVHSLELVPFGYGTEKNTAVFVFETTCGELEHYAVDQLVSRKTGKPVKVADERPFDSGTPIVMAEDRNAENRNDEATHWLIEEVGDGFYRFLNCKTGKLLSESGEGAAVDGRKVHQWEDVSNPAQLWKKVDLDGRFVRFVNKSSGRALNLDASGKTNVWSVKDDESQQWSIQKIDGTIVPLRQESPPQ